MPILQKAQDIYGYLPIEVQTIISNEMNIPLEKIYGVVTFYSQFSLNPKGKYQISVCLGTACYVKGSGDIYNKLQEKLGIEGGGCTPDGKFSLEACRCIGACGLAPVITVNDEVYGRLTVDDVDDILKKLCRLIMFSEISRHLLDIFHNSAEAKATRVSIRIYSNKCAGLLTVEVADNGTGIAKSDLESVTDPFFTSRQNRITGLGIPFFKQSAECTGGTFEILSNCGNGVFIRAVYSTDHADCPVIGNLRDDLAAAVLNENAPDISFFFQSDGKRLEFDTRKMKEEGPADNYSLWYRIRRYFEENSEFLNIDSYGRKIFRYKEEKMKIEELNAIRDKMKAQVTLRAEDPDNTKIVVAMGTCGISAGSREVLTAFANGAAEKNLANVTVTQTGCIGMCQYEPIVEIYEKGKDKVTYVNMSADKAAEVIEKHLIGGQVVSEYTV